MAEKEKKTLDPMADLTPEYISNMDMNAPINDANNSLEMYGDDSSKDNYKTLGGKAEKYTGEWVKTSDVPYDENITTEWLDPNYLFGKESKVYGTQHRGYISQRNDMIASALYNEWKTSMEDVADYLYQQKGFTNSTEEERKNTITSIWKRLWQLKWEWEENQIDSSAMEEELLGKEEEKIYGKTTPDSWKTEEGITALSDANSIHDMMSKERISNVKTLLSTPVESIAISLYKWDIPWDMQAIVDYKTFYPEQWALVEQELKRIRGQWTVNALTKGETVPSNTNGTSAANNEIANFAASNATDTDSMSDILKWVHQTLQSNKAATSASETMDNIESDITDLTNRLQNLRKEANQIFKWDTPDYIVNAYINNRTQEIQNELQKLEQRYQYASNRYDKEVANTQWEKEYKLKERQVKVQEDEYALKKWQVENWITTTTDNKTTSATNPWDKYQVTTKSDAEVWEAVDSLVEMFNNWQLGNAQCWVWIQTYYLPMLWISISGISSLEWKKSLINEDKGYTPKKWDLIIINSGAKLEDWTPAWHIGIVIWVSEDWTIQYLDWNGSLWNDLKWTEEAAIRYIKMDNAKVLGFRNINKNHSDGSTSQTTQYSQWTDTDYANFEKLLDPDASKTEVEWIALKYGYKDNVAALTQIARNALANRPEVKETLEPEEMTWVDYVWLTWEQIEEIEKKIGYNPNIEWELKKIIDKWIPTSWPAMQNVLKTVRAKDEKQLWQWIDHYQNKVNAEAVQAWEDILILLAQLQNDFEDADRSKEVTKDGKTKTVFDTNAMQWRWWGTIWIKYNQLINQLLLNKVTEAREKWATFWQMTEYEWKILEDAASALKIKFGLWSSDESFSKAFFDLVDATWKLTNWTNKWPTKAEWDSFVNQIRKDSEWYMTDGSWNTEVYGSNLWGSKWDSNAENNDKTKNILFGTGS